MRLILLLLLSLVPLWLMAKEPAIRPAVIYDRPSKFDQSFSQAAYINGVLKLRRDGIDVREFEPARGAQIEQAILKLARRGEQPIVGVGYATAPAIEKVAKLFPDQAFVIIDSVVKLPNVQSITFHEEQGAFLAGALAALSSKTKTIGFIGGMDIGLIAKFSCGYTQGARYIDPNIVVLKNYIGSTLNAWNDPTKAIELAKSQIEKSADVLFAAAGGSGHGVYLAAHEANVLAIGVDSNQHHLQPENMLSSMVKKVGEALYHSINDFKQGRWQSGHISYDLSNDGVELVRDSANQHLYQYHHYQRIQHLRTLIISGQIETIVDGSARGCD